MNPNLEYRASKGIEIREAPKDSGFLAILAGIAAPFNKDSVRFKGWDKDWIERIAPGAFKRTLTENPDVLGLWSHDSNKPIARTPDTLILRETDAGLAFEMRVSDTSVGRDLLANIRAKVVDGMSFAFSPVKTQWNETPELDTRTLIDVDLFEVSPVVWPAYPDTTVAMRSHKAFREARAHCPDLKEIMQERSEFLKATSDKEPPSQRERLLRIITR